MSKFIDIHTHALNMSAELIAVKNINLGNDEVYDKSLLACSVGIHPWHIKPSQLVKHFFQLEDLCKEENVVAVGETGLDKLIDTPIDLQIRVFEQQIEIADYHQKAIIVHCVRAYAELISIKRKSKTNVPFIIHGFNKNEQVLKDLLKYDFYISVGLTMLHNNNAKQLLDLIPTEKLFLETDVNNTAIQSIYMAVSEHLNIEIPDLQQLIEKNYQTILCKKIG